MLLPRCLALPLALLACAGVASAEDAPAPYEEAVLPFVRTHCFECHDGTQRKGDVVLDRFTDLTSVQREPRLWKRVRRELHGDAMPPDETESRPPRADAEAVVAWIDAALSAPMAKADPGRVTLRRLNRTEYDNTVRDLFGITLRPARAFPDDDTGYGFDTIGDVLSLPPLLMERYLQAAEAVAAEAILIYRPTERRVQAERMHKTARGDNRDGWARFWTNGEASVQVRVHHTGDYVLRAHAYGDQAGGEPARMAFKIDGKRVGEVEVRRKRGKPKTYSIHTRLGEGVHTFAVAFTNDYYEPKKPAGQRDRNLAVDWVELVGPSEAPVFPSFHQRFVEPARGDPRPPTEALLERAFRRPVRSGEVERYLGVYEHVRADGGSHERGLQGVITAVLVSPSFLFRIEADPAPGKDARRLSEWELATRLSYFLWASTPDEGLLAAARTGSLREQLDAQVGRLLDDPRSYALVEHFAGQWLELRRLDQVTPDPQAFPAFNDDLRRDMRTETERFVEAILREQRSALDLLRARFTFVNERLAKHYGIPGVEGGRFRRVRLPGERAGVLTHASVLTITSNPTRTSPVKRGKWILEVILDDPPGDPPPDVGNLPNTPPEERELSLRAMMEQHAKDPVCASCHTRLDPLGFGLDRFDGIGGFRRREGKFLIDARGELPGGITFEGAVGLRDYILSERREEFVLCLAKKLLIYALGRGPRPADEAPLRALVRSLAPDYRMTDLVRGIVQLDAFQRKGSKR